MTRGSGRSPGQRQLRVGEELRHALAEVFARGSLRDPALKDASVTVTEVRISPDLRNATAFVTPLGGGDATELLAALARAAPYVRGQIGRMMRLRFTPAIAFELDTSFDRVSYIDALLRRPAVAADLDGEAGDDDDGA
ncbi:MAG: 30S ribosome-binding factor RbfA [Proteobacteria bacterium]|nr:30S ribosome-binding factor RbfA [Pseudomonadota bacterium]